MRYKKKKDGPVFSVDISSGVFFTGGRRKIVGAVRDITERKRAEASLAWELHVNKSLAEPSGALIAPGQSIEQVLACANDLTDSEHGYVSEIDRATGESVGHTLTAMLGAARGVTGPGQRIAFRRGDDGTYGKFWWHALNTGDAFWRGWCGRCWTGGGSRVCFEPPDRACGDATTRW